MEPLNHVRVETLIPELLEQVPCFREQSLFRPDVAGKIGVAGWADNGTSDQIYAPHPGHIASAVGIFSR